MKMAKSPGSPSRSIISNQTDSVLTESTDDEESNFISLLQYKDAFHLLGLKKETSPDPAEIRRAYTTCRDQTIAALERCEENERRQGSLLISQTNYLELKLNALDQAIGELLPEDNNRNSDGAGQSNQQIQQHYVSLPLHQQETVEQQTRRKQLNSPSGRSQTLPKDQIQTQEPSSSIAGSSLAKVDDDDGDDLDTIDIYFNSSKNTEPKASDQSDTISIITWDAASIFSMISNNKTNEDAASESAHSEGLRSAKRGRGTVAAAKQSMSRPPLSINRAITSPRSITEFSPSIHDRGQYKEVGHPAHKKVVTARGRLNRASQKSTSDAVRQGVMRALDEDDSECVSLDFEDGRPQIETKQRTIEKGNIHHEEVCTMSDNRKSKGLTKRGGPHQNRGRDDISDGGQVSSASSSSKDEDVGGRHNRRRTRKTEPKQEEDLYDSLVQSGVDGYNAVLESSMQLSNQLCDALQACWLDDNNDAFGDDEGSTGESTAFDTLSSFSKCGSSGAREARLDDLNKRRLV